jgi:predicted secreted protein
MSLDTVETSYHGSASGWRTFVPGLIDGGEVTLDLLFDPSEATQMNSTGLLSELTGRSVEGFKVIWPDASTFSFDGLVTRFEPGAPFEGALTGSATIKVTGAITFA